MTVRYDAGALVSFCLDGLLAEGLDRNHAKAVARVLVEGDLLGHSTHGVALLPRYLEELRGGRMRQSGVPEVIHDSGNAAAWDGGYLPGPSLVRSALDVCRERALLSGVATVAIGRSHHIACLAAYLKPVTDEGMAVIIASSSPATASVAPFGAVEGVYSPNPLAAGWPTSGDPVLIDISASITTNSLTSQLAESGERLPGHWIIGPDGQPSDNPSLLSSEPSGALLPVGGLDHGHKGFALGLLVEMLTSGLAGTGRADAPGRWGASVFVMVIDPARHGGLEAFERQTSALVASCRRADVPAGGDPVRIPGERALKARRDQMKNGIALTQSLVARLHAAVPGTRLHPVGQT